MKPLQKLYGPGVANVNVRLTFYDKVVLAHLCRSWGVKPPDIFRMFLRHNGRKLESQGKLKRTLENGRFRWKLESEGNHPQDVEPPATQEVHHEAT